MAVIPFPMDLSPQGPNPQMQWGLRSLSARNMSPLNGVATTLDRPGSHWAARLPYENLATDRRARLQTFAASTRGYANRFYVPLFGWTRRGSFPAPELLTNNTFASGTTGWTQDGGAMTVSDGLLRTTRSMNNSTTDLHYNSSALTVTQYAPYAARCIDHQGRSTNWIHGVQLGSSPGQEDYGRVTSASFGLKTLAAILPAASTYFGFVDYDTGANRAGDYIQSSYTSLARCALVDNGPNELLRSDELDNASWTKSATTVTANASAAPDGTTTADALVENTASTVHSLLQSFTRASAAADICAYGYFQRGSGTRDVRLFTGDIAGGNYAGCTFDLGGGTAGSVTLTGTATNGRAFIVAAGNGWYYCALVVRTPASVNARVTVEMVNGGSTNYLGDGASSIRVWRFGGALSSVPTRGMQTTSAGDSDGTLQTGSALYLKGLPASTNGLLLQGDPVEIITNTSSQLVRVRAPLNSDAAGLGYLQFEAPLRVSPLDNAAVIVCNPLCRMMLDSPNVDWMERAAGFSDLEFAAVEDTYP